MYRINVFHSERRVRETAIAFSLLEVCARAG